jgi:uncharacterized protein
MGNPGDLRGLNGSILFVKIKVLAQQSWSNGKIGVFGCSNTGEAALHAPTAMPPHLKAVFAGCYSWNKFDGFFRGGILANWGTGPQTSPLSAGLSAIPVDEDVDGSMLKEAISQHEKQISLLGLWKSMPFRDSWSDLVGSRFWQEGSVSTYQNAIERTGVGIYSYGGWYDDFRREALVARANLHNDHRRRSSRKRSRATLPAANDKHLSECNA